MGPGGTVTLCHFRNMFQESYTSSRASCLLVLNCTLHRNDYIKVMRSAYRICGKLPSMQQIVNKVLTEAVKGNASSITGTVGTGLPASCHLIINM